MILVGEVRMQKPKEAEGTSIDSKSIAGDRRFLLRFLWPRVVGVSCA
jgi:hypothetical protein